MRWPWQSRETREASGGYTEIISRLIEAQAAGTTQQASATAATEAAAGLLSRSLSSATVEAPDELAEAVSPRCLAQIGRDLIRVGESLHVIRYMGGRLVLIPCSSWYFEGDADPATWLATCTAYGPSGSSTWRVPWSSVVFASWGSPTARPYHGLSPSTWAADTARLNANAERGLADEMGGPIAQLLARATRRRRRIRNDDALAGLRDRIFADARGKAMLVETVSASGWGEGKTAAPSADWKQQRLGPHADRCHGRSSPMIPLLASWRRADARPRYSMIRDGTSKRESASPVAPWHRATARPATGGRAFRQAGGAGAASIRSLQRGSGRARASISKTCRGRRRRQPGAGDIGAARGCLIAARSRLKMMHSCYASPRPARRRGSWRRG